jgi:WD40 repeat protein
VTATVAPAEPGSGTKRSPFVGLEPYSEGDAAFFFGREREKRIITSNLRAARLTLFYGSSGVGKSSVLLAGVVHDLRERVALAAPRTRTTAEPAPFSITYFNAWRDARPLGRLMEQIRVSAVAALGGEPLDPWDGVTSPIETLTAWTRRVSDLLVVLDQFEEYFFYHPDETGPGTFLEEFPKIVNDGSLQVNFILAIREDAWSKLDRFKGAIPDLFSNYLRLGHLNRDAARRAIEGPIEEYNRRYAGEEGEVGIEPALVDSVLAGVESGKLQGGAPSADGAQGDAPPEGDGAHGGTVETPFLQLVVDRLWEATRAKGGRMLTDDTLKELGGPAEIVRGHLERAMSELSPDEQAVAADSFRFLVTSSKTKVAQRVSDLADWTGHPAEEVDRVLGRLSSGQRGRILRPLPPPPGEDGDRFEIFHDVLADPILAWRRRFQKQRDAKALARQLEQEESARLADERARHRHQVNRLRWAGAIVAAILAIGLATALVFIYQQKTARSKTFASASIGQLGTDPELSLLLAREAWNQKHTSAAEDALRRALGSSLVRRRIPMGEDVQQALPDRAGQTALVFGVDRVQRRSLRDGRALGAPIAFDRTQAQPAVSGDGSTLVTATKRQVTIQSAGLKPVRAMGGASSVAVGAGGRYAAAVYPDAVRIWDARSGSPQPVKVLKQDPRAPFDAISLQAGNGTRLVGISYTSSDATVVDWKSRRRPQRVTARGPSDRYAPSFTAELSPDGRKVATAVVSQVVRIWDTRTGRPLGHLTGDSKGVTAIAWSPDSKKLVVAGDKQAELVDAQRSARLAAVLGSATDLFLGARWSADSKRIVAAYNDGTATVFDANVGKKIVDLRGHTGSVNSAAFVGPGYQVVTGSSDKTVRLWDTTTGLETPAQGDWVLDAAYRPNSSQVALATTQGRRPGAAVARIWDPSTGDVRDVRTGSLVEARTLDFDRSGGRLLVGGAGSVGRGDVEVVDPATRLATPLPGPFDSLVTTVRFSPDGHRIAVAMQAGPKQSGLSVVDLAKGHTAPRQVADAPGTPFYGLAFSPRGDLLVAGDDQGRLHIYDPRGDLKRAKRVVPAHDSAVMSIAFSPDGKRVVTASQDHTARVWDVRNWDKTPRVLRPGTGSGTVGDAQFSPDGRMIVTGGSDRTIRVWDADSGKLIGLETPHADFIDTVEFSRDGGSILSGSDDELAKITPCPTCVARGKLVKLAAERSTRPLTADERQTYLGK